MAAPLHGGDSPIRRRPDDLLCQRLDSKDRDVSEGGPSNPSQSSEHCDQSGRQARNFHFERAFNPDTLSEWSEEGTEIIDGRKCRRFVGRYLDEHSQPIGDAHEVRFIDAKTGLPRRELDFDMRGKLVTTTEYLNAKIGPPPRHVFEIPKGYKRGYHRTKRVHA